MHPSPFVRRVAAVAGALAIAWTASAVCARAADREVLVAQHLVNSTPSNDRVAHELQGAILDDLYASGLSKGVLCYDVISRGDIGALLTLEERRELLGDDSNADTTFQNLQRVVSAPYLATLAINRINDRYIDHRHRARRRREPRVRPCRARRHSRGGSRHADSADRRGARPQAPVLRPGRRQAARST